MKKVIKFIITILLLKSIIIYSSCSFLNEYPKNEVSYKDSLLINYALYQISKGNVHFNWYKRFPDIDFDSSYFKLQIENIYYSPDSLKALVFFTENYKDKPIEGVKKLDPNIYISGRSIALLRDSKYEPWELYFIDFFIPSRYTDREEVRILFEKYYRFWIINEVRYGHSNKYTFEEILEKKGFILDSNNQVIINPKYTRNEQIGISIKFKLNEYLIDFENKYGIDDKEFWTESIVWKKGIRLPDLYIFQTDSHIIMEDYMMNYNIQYPDSIIQMYKEK